MKQAREMVIAQHKGNTRELEEKLKHLDKVQEQQHKIKDGGKDKKEAPAVKTQLEKEPIKRFGNITQNYKVGKPDNIDPPPNTPPVTKRSISQDIVQR